MSIEKGSKVKVEFTGKLQNGTVFDKSDKDKPLEFTVGEGRIIPGFEQAVAEMDSGEVKTVTIPKEKAYGNKDTSLMRRFNKSALPQGFVPEKGMLIELGLPSGDIIPATIVEVSDSDVVVDLNHPLAGQDLTFDIKVLDVKSPAMAGQK
jgi:FKBP-type peptidyl-prolyl cis-trans isomerase 2